MVTVVPIGGTLPLMGSGMSKAGEDLGRVGLGVPVADAVGLKPLAHPSRRVAIAHDSREAVPLDEVSDLPDHALKVVGLGPAGSPSPHDVLDDPPLRALPSCGRWPA
jgi:hypothetical protein